MKGLTKKQQSILSFIEAYLAENGECPSVREIAEKHNISAPSSYMQLKALEKKGKILMHQGRGKGIRLKGETRKKLLLVPFYGKKPHSKDVSSTLSEERAEFLFPEGASSDGYFAFIATSDEMKNAGILKGDILCFSRDASFKNGDIVAVSATEAEDDEIIVRRIFSSPSRFELRPENDSVSSLFCQRPMVHGILYESWRNYDGS